MPKALSFDLRSRVLAAIDAGLSCRQAAARFGVSASSAKGMRRSGGDARPKPQGGDRLSRRTDAHADLIHAALAEVASGRSEVVGALGGREGVDEALRTGWFRPVHVRTMGAPVLANDSEVVSMTTTESSLNRFKGRPRTCQETIQWVTCP